MVNKNKRINNRKNNRENNRKSGQVEITFNWFYLLIAGAVILLFFVGIVMKQKASAEETFGIDVIRIMQSIFTGAQVSEKTQNIINVAGLADYTLYFNCEEETSAQGRESVGEYGIKDHSARVENNIDPLFAPLEIKTTQLITWSLPYKFPFKVIDFLFITSANTKYILTGEREFAFEFLNATEKLNRDYFFGEDDYKKLDPKKNYQFRFVDLNGDLIKEGKALPEKFAGVDDNKVTAAVFLNDKVDYYQKSQDRGNTWHKISRNSVRVISVGGERDAAKYAAIFAGNDKIYLCNMQKAFQRLKYLLPIYQGKMLEMENYYLDHPELRIAQSCLNYINELSPNLKSSLESVQNRVLACTLDVNSCDTELITSAQDVLLANKNLAQEGDCLKLY